jgi:hypothetical protein
MHAAFDRAPRDFLGRTNQLAAEIATETQY